MSCWEPIAPLLRRRVGEDWLPCAAEAAALAEAMRLRCWRERVHLFDRYCWQRARVDLDPQTVARLVHRRLRQGAERAALDDYVRRCAAVLEAALLLLAEPPRGPDRWAALLSRLARLATRGFRAQAAVAVDLVHGPGLALLLLASLPSDTAASSTARDVFWSALHGR